MLKNKIIGKKIRNIVILLMSIIIIIGTYKYIDNSRAEKVVKIETVISDSYGYLSDEKITLEARQIEDNLYEVKLPESVNTKKINQMTQIMIGDIETTEENKIYLTKEQVEEQQLNLQVEYDVKELEGSTKLYNKILKYEDKENGKLVEVKGYLPVDAELQIKEVTQEQLTQIFGEKKIKVAYDIKILEKVITEIPGDEANPEAKPDKIEETIEINPEEFGEKCEVTITDANIAEKSQVYHVKEDNTYEQVNVKESTEGNVSFEAQSFSVYAVGDDEITIENNELPISEDEINASDTTVFLDNTVDTIKPQITYKYSETDINYTEKKLNIVFDATDNNFASSTLNVESLTILVDGEEPNWAKTTRKFTSVTDIKATVNGAEKVIGKQYTLQLSNLEQKPNDGFKYSGIVTVGIPEGKVIDTSGNTNNAQIITVGIDEQEPYPYIPEGYTKLDETNLDNGLVVEDPKGNQYVWVEVPQTEEVYPTAGLKITNFTDTEYTKIENDLHTYTSIYRNGTKYVDEYYSDATTGLTRNQYDVQKKKMLKSIYENGGFYVGRYETGIENSYRTASGDATQTPVIKQNAYPYNWVTATQSQTLSTKFASSGYISSLIFGIQWDLMMKYLETKGATTEELKIKSTDWGNYSNTALNITNTSSKYSTNDGFASSWKNGGSYKKASGTITILTTGANMALSKQNIYDIGGNVYEWTLEYSKNTTSPCANRGGNYRYLGTDYPASSRGYGSVDQANTMSGFRVVLYKDPDAEEQPIDPKEILSAEKLTANNYGGVVTNYNPTNGSTVGWKIFHTDGENIYLIADNYINHQYVPAGKKGTKYNSSNGSYGTNLNAQADYTGTVDISQEIKDKLLSKYTYTSTSNNAKATAYLLDTGVWSTFKDNTGYAKYAIGAPTLELFTASYNTTHSTQIDTQVSSSAGYRMKWSTGSTYGTGVDNIDSQNNLYAINNLYGRTVFGTWLASPNANSTTSVVLARSEDTQKGNPPKVNFAAYTSNGGGLRPVIVLNSEYGVEKQSNGTYLIRKLPPREPIIVDVVNPAVVYSTSSINRNNETVTVEFKVQDKYLDAESVTLSEVANKIKVKVLDENGKQLVNDSTSITQTFTLVEKQDQYVLYRIVLSNFGENQGKTSIIIPENIAKDKSGNTNVETEILVGNPKDPTAFSESIVDFIEPTITVTPTSCTWRKSALSVTITTADKGGSGLASSNSYQYYLSNSSTALSGGAWTNYTSGTAISLNPGKSGTYYLFVKRVNDNAGNTSTANGTATAVSGTTYQRFGAYKFDYDKPTISVNTTSCTWRNSALSVTITVADTGGSGLLSSNSYQYYLSNSSTALSGGAWTDYTSGTAISLNPGKSGTYYLFVKRVNDNAGNTSTANGTAQAVDTTTYQRFGAYQFDYDKPIWSTQNINLDLANKVLTVDLIATDDMTKTDVSGYASSSLTAGDISVYVDGVIVNSIDKILSQPVSVTNGIKYTLTITGWGEQKQPYLDWNGIRTIEIKENTITDKAGNTSARQQLILEEAQMYYTPNFTQRDETELNYTTDSKVDITYTLYDQMKQTPYANGDYRVISTTAKLPLGTKLTLKDYVKGKIYYYHIIDENSNYQVEGEKYIYRLSNFMEMGSTDKNYIDSSTYYDSTAGYVLEKYNLSIDFLDANINADKLAQETYLELRSLAEAVKYDNGNTTVKYNLRYGKNAIMSETISNEGQTYTIEENTEIPFKLDASLLEQKTSDGKTIMDTKYYDKIEGIAIELLDENGNRLKEIQNFKIIDVANATESYEADKNGVIRIPIMQELSSISKNYKMILSKNGVETGKYSVNVYFFASDDGKHIGDEAKVQKEFYATFKNAELGLLGIEATNESRIVNKETGLNLEGNRGIDMTITVGEPTSKTNIRVELYKRNQTYTDPYENINYTGTLYTLVDLKDYLDGTWQTPEECGLVSETDGKEYMLLPRQSYESSVETTTIELERAIKASAGTGEYKIVIKSYDDNSLAQTVSKTFIVAK